MKNLHRLLLLLVFGSLLSLAVPVAAQDPPPTPPPAILVIEPTPSPTPAPQGTLLQQVWQKNKEVILLGLGAALVSGILVGVFLRQIAETLTQWVSRLSHFLFDRFASAPLLRLRYEKGYRETLARNVQTLASSNLVDREVRLEKVYVPVQLTEETRAGRGSTFEDLIQWDEDRRRRQRQRAVEPWEAVRRFQRLVVLGEPGAGKTTYLAHLAYMCARQERLPTHLPVFIRLQDLAAVQKLEDALPQVLADHNFPNAERFVHRRLADGRCLILLDGLDEVDSLDRHRQVVRLVQEFAGQHVRDKEPGNIVVVSSRTYSYEHGPQLRGFAKTMVMDFDDPAIERFVHNWFSGEDLMPLATRLLATLSGNRRFKELARNPLLLLLIANHYERERNLPKLRADLYDECIETRIARWNERRGTHRGQFGKRDKRRLLRELALYLYREEQRGLLDEDTLLTWLDRFAAGLRLPEGTTPADLLEEVVRTSGLIQERAIHRYGFSHLTLQEYFAAEAAYLLGPEEGAELLGKHLAAPRWQEVVLLYCGLADDANLLLHKVFERATSGGAEGWLQAGRCLAEGARNVAPETCRGVADGLFDLLRRAEADGAGTLTPDESGEVVASLRAFAPGELPRYARDLLRSGGAQDAILAARLLPEGADAGLQDEISQRMAELARSGEVAQRRVASAALGWVAQADMDTVATLRAGLGDADAAAREESARALGRLRAGDEATAAALAGLYTADPDDAPRHAALEALLALGRARELGMVPVPAGEFLMGSTQDDRDARDNEKPQHRLYLPAYHIDRTPVTNAQYGRFLEAGGYGNPAYWAEAIQAGRWEDGSYVNYGGERTVQPRYWGDAKWNGVDLPVVGVSWYEALAYAHWAGKRLPTEAEWEKAARWDPEAGRSRRYPWGDDWDPGRCNTEESGPRQTSPVGRYSPTGDSACGAADMAGNVLEWCSTRWGYEYPYDPDDGREDLLGGDEVGRILRGGSWSTDRKWARCAFRVGDSPWNWDYNRGFRCCCATPSPPSGPES